jgi:hypothetical protein
MLTFETNETYMASLAIKIWIPPQFQGQEDTFFSLFTPYAVFMDRGADKETYILIPKGSIRIKNTIPGEFIVTNSLEAKFTLNMMHVKEIHDVNISATPIRIWKNPVFLK